jgi:pyruvate ferredoxin oxidoreductase gamma subunit/2-oxoisovalerate ferredoxin oxidoreductase gamma subunit
MYEARFHGRGGQGAVTAANILAAAAYAEGKYSQAFPIFGVERRGAPVAAFLRIDEKPIDIKFQIYEPDAVIIQDPSLLEVKEANVRGGLKSGGTVIINTKKDPSEFDFGDATVYTIDSTGIAVENRLGTKTNPIVNTAIIGAFVRTTGTISLEAAEKAVYELSPAKRDENVAAMKAAYERVKGV